MKLSRKQEIYIEIMNFILPHLRNIQTHSFWWRIKYGTFYAEIELVHNIGRCVAVPEFTKADVWWLNAQGAIYVKHGKKDLPFYDKVCGLLDELAQLIPKDLRSELTYAENGNRGVK